MDGPGPGSYDTPKAIISTQWGKIKGPINQTEKAPCFTDRIRNSKKWVPGVGHYKNVDNHAKTLHKDREFAKTFCK